MENVRDNCLISTWDCHNHNPTFFAEESNWEDKEIYIYLQACWGPRGEPGIEAFQLKSLQPKREKYFNFDIFTGIGYASIW